jgi:hypothetical protein
LSTNAPGKEFEQALWVLKDSTRREEAPNLLRPAARIGLVPGPNFALLPCFGSDWPRFNDFDEK